AEVPVRVRALVTARPTATARTEVDVNGSLAFRAHGEDLPFVIQRRVTTGFGMVSLTREARIERVRQTRRGLTATAYLNPWTKIHRLSFSCEAITLQGEPTETPTPLRDLADGVQMRALPNILSVHRAPGHPQRIRVHRQQSMFLMHVFGERGDWVHAEWSDTLHQVRGWVRRRDLRRHDGSHGWGTTGGHGTPGCLPMGRIVAPGWHEGAATIDPGTEVYTAADGPAWAEVTGGKFGVRWQDEAEFAQIIEAQDVDEGDSCGLHHAWVRRDAVHPN
ncbi:MAG: hypothetical protein AAGE52_22980, partial [Myxococcota bacterium]